MKPDEKEILRDALRLKDDVFGLRDKELEERARYRFRLVAPQIPDAYKDTATEYRSPLIEEEGRQAFSLIYAFPQPHLTPPTPEDQPLTTQGEQFLAAAHQELEAFYGAVSVMNVQSQLHSKCGVIYLGMKRAAYKGGPTPPDASDPYALAEFQQQNDAYKREAGIADLFDYRFVPFDTFYYVGNIRNPLRVYEIKQVDEAELMAQYDLRKDKDGQFSRADITTMPSGEPRDRPARSTRKVNVVEYWDREWCFLLVENLKARWRGTSSEPLVLDSWHHAWGRVPYFCAPAFENEGLQEEQKFSSPLDGLYAEIGEYNNRRTMMSNVAYLKGYPSWQEMLAAEGSPALDAQGNPQTSTKFQPGLIYHTRPGAKIADLPMQTGSELYQELLSMEARLRQFGISDVARGVSPGADTSNAALTNLRALQRSALQPLVQNVVRQYREMYRFMLERIRGGKGESLGETAYAYDATTDTHLSLEPAEIITMNVQVNVAPDTGRDDMIKTDFYSKLLAQRQITPLEFHEARGKENPEEYVRAQILWDMFTAMLPGIQTQILANLGFTDAIARMVAENQASGDARNIVPTLMEEIRRRQNPEMNGAGRGSPGRERAQGLRSPAVATNTQPGPFSENGIG